MKALYVAWALILGGEFAQCKKPFMAVSACSDAQQFALNCAASWTRLTAQRRQSSSVRGDEMTATQPTLEGARSIKRRSVLQGIGGVAAAALGAAVTRADAVAAEIQTDASAAPIANEVQPSGYRLTEHIRAYYRTARL
jgi:hypothetical protein